MSTASQFQFIGQRFRIQDLVWEGEFGGDRTVNACTCSLRTKHCGDSWREVLTALRHCGFGASIQIFAWRLPAGHLHDVSTAIGLQRTNI